MSKRQHEFTIEIDAPTEVIWKALTEAEGLQKWFVPSAAVTPGLGGSLTLSWGEGCEGTAAIHLWEEGKRFGTTEGAKQVEYEIEAIDGGKTRLRLVHSGFGADAKFDQEYESTHGGWLTFLAMLKHSAEHHADAPATHVHELRMLTVPVGEQWESSIGPLGIDIDSLVEGEPYQANLGGIALAGSVIRYPKPGYLALSAPGSIVALFVEKSGESSMQTIQWILFGDARGRAEEVRQALARFNGAQEPTRAAQAAQAQT